MYALHLPDAIDPLWHDGVRPVPIAAGRRRTPAPAGPPRKAGDGDLEAAALATLEKLNRGVLLVSAEGELAFANRAARAMLGRNDGLALRRRRLEFADPAIESQYRRFIEQAHDADGGPSLVLRVPGPQKKGAYRVLVCTLETGQASAAFSVFVYEPDNGQRRLPGKVLAALYGLSPSEARLANELFVGRSVQEAAAALDITVNTARSTLKRIFGKCAVGSQAELLQLLALGPRTV